MNYLRMLFALLGAFSYEREEEDLKKLYIEVYNRMRGINCPWSEDGNIVYSSLICAFGDYGTSPRSGWFEDPIIADTIANALKREIDNWEM